jgi:hypothetical protein
MSSSDDEDMSLADLAKQQKQKKKKKTPAKKKTPSAKKKKKATPVLDSSDDDDEDNMSLADLAAQKKKKKPASKKKKTGAAGATAAAKKKKAAASKKKKAAASKKRARASDKSSSSKPAKKRKTTAASKKKSNLQGYNGGDTEKEFKTSIDDFKDGTGHSRKIVQSNDVKLQLSLAVLCRWWYVLEWPENTGPSPGSDFVEMAGSPGVYVGVNNDVVGKVVDTRDHASPNKPSLANMLSKDCSELIQLWVGALEKQVIEMKAKNDDYRCGNSDKNGFQKLLENELKHANGLDGAKLQKVADRQAKKKAKKR